MATFRLYVDTENGAFVPDPAPELARILREVADRVEGAAFRGESLTHYLTIFDAVGNDVGRFALKPRDGEA